MNRRLFVLLLTVIIALSVFSLTALAEENDAQSSDTDALYTTGEDTFSVESDPDVEVEKIYTADDNIYVKTSYDKLGWAVWIIAGGIVTVAVVFLSKYLERKVR